MKRHFLTKCVLLLCPFFGQQLAAQTLTWKPEKLQQHTKIGFSYQPKGGDLEFSTEVKADLAVHSDNKWRNTSITLIKNNDDWTGEYQLPAHASFIALKFYQGDSQNPDAVDNRNGKGYFQKVLDAKGKDVPGTYLAEAGLRTGLTGDWTLNSFVKPIREKKVIDSLLSREEKISNRSLRPVLFNYLDIKQLSMPAEEFNVFADGLIKTELKKGDLSEDLLAGMHRYYSRLKNEKAGAEVEAIIFKKYPKSNTARFIAYKKASDVKSAIGSQQAAEDFLKSFPYAEWKKSANRQDFIYYSIFRGLGSSYFETGQNEKFLGLFKEIDFKTANEIYRWNLTRGQLMGKGDQKLLYRFSSVIIPYLLERQKDNSYLSDFGNDTAKAQLNAESQMDDRLFTHIYFANAQGDYAGANQYFKYLSKKGAYANADLNALQLNILEKLNAADQSIKSLLESSVSANAVTPVMFVKLKSIYKNEHNGREDGYEQYLSGLIPADKKNEMRAHVMANMVNYPLVPFSLENADGKMVNSKDWADQIVVIDFWATWCRPCIMAFPGMQLLVDQYAKDPKVGIYMIGTMQTGDYKAKSVNYVRGEGYRFNLLHDAVGPKGEQDQVFKSLLPLFKTSAIPRKIIVKNGMVRYSSEGYSGSPSQLRDELSTAIEILRSEK